jgi:protein subunit release factor A
MSDLPSGVTISAWPQRPLGGQRVGVDAGVKLEHEGYGLTVIVNNGRSQHTNKLIALDMMLSGLTNPRVR